MILANNDIGLYKFRKELIISLVKNYQVYIVLPHGDFVEELVQLGCVFCPVNLNRRGTNPIDDLKLLNEYRKLLCSIKPDVVLTYTIKPNIYGGIACMLHRIPYVTNITGLGTAVENKGILQKITIRLYKFALKKAQKVFFQNEENRLFMIRHGIISGANDILPGSGVNLELYKPLSYPNADAVDFVFVARVMKEKGIDQYLEAAEYIHSKYPYARFHICGFCEEDYQQVISQMCERAIVIYHGSVKDMIPIYKMSSCTIHPTYYPEGMSNVLLESCASARPIITTDRPGCKEIVEDGINGYIVKEKDSGDLIEKIEQFLQLTNEQRKEMGLRGREKVEREFDRNIVVNKYLAEIDNDGRL